ncbi:hypothetical protein niasHT_028800 [Heterodera trifolii]|uniref:BTB domain-containing protein n=1 Tax=Heterodera trifolii TaxID=157864 RepID=A0ABD2KQL0_9BILA
MSISLADRMKLLLTNGDGADIQFLVLKAHKLILMAASDVFKAMFRFDAQNAKTKTSSSAEQLQSVEITDIDANVFKVMLSFIYAEDSSGLTGDNLIAVLYAGFAYMAVAMATIDERYGLFNLFTDHDDDAWNGFMEAYVLANSLVSVAGHNFFDDFQMIKSTE